MITWLFIISWVACGVLSYGITLAYLQRNWPTLADQMYNEDVAFSCMMAALGPTSLLICYFKGDRAKHGLQFRKEKMAGGDV